MSEADHALGSRMKRYELVTRSILLPHSLTILRVDGRAFHSYLRDAAKPFDFDFIKDMQEVARALVAEVGGTVMAYGQSDEISLLISDEDPQAQPWFGGVVQKMASIAAGVATAALILQRGTKRLPHFDARVFTVPSWVEAGNYFVWRQRDAVRNSISMAAQSTYLHKELMYQNAGSMQQMLWEKGINWNDYPEEAKRGWVLSRAYREEPVTYTHKRTLEEVSTVATHTRWEISAPQLTTGSARWFSLAIRQKAGVANDELALDQEAATF